VRLQGTLRLYVPLPWRLLVATRLHVGTIEPIDGSHAVPLWERFYAGGIDSVRVRSLARGPAGPRSAARGRLTDMSFELRRSLTRRSPWWPSSTPASCHRELRSTREDFQRGIGIGAQYGTPIGPIRPISASR
jgi:outer membrane translocation and assembly module TamA